MPCMIKVIGRFLGSIIRDACEVDIGPSSDCLGKFFRVRVAIKVDKPLRQFLRVDVLGDGEETAMPVQYELLLNLCFFCRLLGHMIRDCSNAKVRGSLNDKDLVYGAWLKAASLTFQAARRSWSGHFEKQNQRV
ncbi:hypothetical protein LWI28_026574 [Acer negundo]|uniref:Zinc knuckle CX2CX4HX4C domain-containing protein n=1 Tax=Acer negundo TaxID=4023 RepID=A0AAD5JR56_ACENE|nr:hypothetical protein LWI28_026574 [Acer negundo]